MFNAPLKMFIPALGLTVLLAGCTTDGTTYAPWPGADNGMAPTASYAHKPMPALTVTDSPAPDVIYNRGSRDTVLSSTPDDNDTQTASPAVHHPHVETLVTRKVAELSRDLHALQHETASFDGRLQALESKSDQQASEYYAYVAGINSQLQAGTTAGNPILIQKWNAAQKKLNDLSLSEGQLNDLATDLSNEASKASFLLESARATFGLSGAVEEDHKKLTAVEDEVNQTIVHLNRLLNQVNDEITRRTTYLRSERLNMQTLSLAIANGQLYGQSLTNSLFKRATNDGMSSATPAPKTRRPLVIIRFDHPNVNYQQALYTAVSQALEKYPAAKFDLVAVSPASGNAAQVALNSDAARKDGEAVLRSLTQMGLPIERVRLNAAQSKNIQDNEVHIYIQ